MSPVSKNILKTNIKDIMSIDIVLVSLFLYFICPTSSIVVLISF